MLELPIDLEMLQEALDNASYEMAYYLDKETGEILFSTEDFPLEALPGKTASKSEIQAFEQRYLAIPVAQSQEGYSDMEAFITTVEAPELRDKLAVAIDGKGAFRRFKNVLLEEPTERKRWFEFKTECSRRRTLRWLKGEGIIVPGEPDID